MKLQELIQQSSFQSPGHEAMLNVLATASWISAEMSAAMTPFGITQAQYNVLRILRGQHPGCYTCSEVGSRLLDRTPDVTRLLVRLESRGLLTRKRAEHDRRVVEVSISPLGLQLLSDLDEPVAAAIEKTSRHLSDDDLRTLSELLEALRRDQGVETESEAI